MAFNVQLPCICAATMQQIKVTVKPTAAAREKIELGGCLLRRKEKTPNRFKKYSK